MAFMDYMPQFGQNIPNQIVGDQNVSTDDAALQLALKRRLAQADALRQAQMPQGQMISGHYVAPSWTQYLANAYGKMQANADERAAIQDYSQAQANKAKKYADLLGEPDNAKFQQGLAQMPEFVPELVKSKLAGINKEDVGQIIPAGATFYKGGKAVYTTPTKPEKPQAPVVRTMRIGNDEVTQQWNPDNNKWSEIGRGPAFKPEAPDVSVQDLSPAALDMAAETYRTTGVLPATGFGKQGAQLKREIMNRAGELNTGAGISAQDASANALQGKGDVAAYNQLQKQSTMVKSFEKTARANGDLALDLSNKADRTGSPIINKWLQAGQKSISGNPDVSAFNAANETFVNEYAKIMSGSMGNTPVSDSARQHAHEMLSTVQTKDQYKAVMNVLRKEMDNRLHGFDVQLEESRKRLNRGKSGQPKVINFEDL